MLNFMLQCYVILDYVMPCHLMSYYIYYYCQSHVMSHYVALSWCFVTLPQIMSSHVIMDKFFHESGSIPTLPLPINLKAAAGKYLGWQGEQSGTWSPLICPVEALIPLLGAPGCSSSLPTAWRQISLLAFEVGVDLKGLSSGFLEAWQ